MQGFAARAVSRERAKDQATSQTRQQIPPQGAFVLRHNRTTRVLPVAYPGLAVNAGWPGLAGAPDRSPSIQKDTSIVDDFFSLGAVVISAVSIRLRSSNTPT